MSDPYVKCLVCGKEKCPRGRSMPLGLSMCDWECKGYDSLPWPSTYWPGERDAEAQRTLEEGEK